MREPASRLFPLMSENAETGGRLGRDADHDHGTARTQEAKVRVVVMLRGDRVEHEVEAARMRREHFGVARLREVDGAEPSRVRFLCS